MTMYLIAKRLNQHHEPELTCIGPFDTEADLMTFAKGLRFFGGQAFYKSLSPQEMYTVNPDDLFPWEPEQIRVYTTKF